MALPQPTPPVTAAGYLRREAEQPNKHEYVRSETFAAYRRIEHYRRIQDNRWALQEFEP